MTVTDSTVVYYIWKLYGKVYASADLYKEKKKTKTKQKLCEFLNNSQTFIAVKPCRVKFRVDCCYTWNEYARKVNLEDLAFVILFFTRSSTHLDCVYFLGKKKRIIYHNCHQVHQVDLLETVSIQNVYIRRIELWTITIYRLDYLSGEIQATVSRVDLSGRSSDDRCLVFPLPRRDTV